MPRVTEQQLTERYLGISVAPRVCEKCGAEYLDIHTVEYKTGICLNGYSETTDAEVYRCQECGHEGEL